MARERERFRKIESLQNRLAQLVRDQEFDLLDIVLRFIFDNIEFEGGEFKDTAGNIARLSGLNREYDDFKKSHTSAIARQFTTDLLTISEMNARYYEQFVSQNRLEKLEQAALNKQLKVLGFEPSGLKRGGFMDSILNSDEPINEVKAEISRMAAARTPRADVTKAIENLIAGDTKDKLGILEKHHYSIINDTYNEVERGISKGVADRQGYEFATYSGGRMTTTRDWCDKRAGEIFHRSEIEDWKNSTWQGKINKAWYDPYRHCGGYNCQHGWNFIPTATAKARGKDVDKFIRT